MSLLPQLSRVWFLLYSSVGLYSYGASGFSEPKKTLLLLLLLLLPSRFSRVQLCDPIDSSPPGSAVPGILQARTLEWVAISFSIHESEK